MGWRRTHDGWASFNGLSALGPGLGPLRILKAVHVWMGQISLAASREITFRIEIASAIAGIRLPRHTGYVHLVRHA